jgi:purine-binding chemotaxis protein CheW
VIGAEPQPKESDVDPLKLVCFRLRDQELGIPIEAVRETIRVRPITRVFLTPAWLFGIFSLRGEIVPAIDVAPWLGMRRTAIDEESRLVVLRHSTKVLAILVDSLAELRTLDRGAVIPAPPTLGAEQSALLAGVAATATGTVRILDPEAIFESEWLRTLAALGRRETTGGAVTT